MILLDTLVKENILREDQIPEVIKIADDKYYGSVDQALLNFNIDENKLLEVNFLIYLLKIWIQSM